MISMNAVQIMANPPYMDGSVMNATLSELSG